MGVCPGEETTQALLRQANEAKPILGQTKPLKRPHGTRHQNGHSQGEVPNVGASQEFDKAS